MSLLNAYEVTCILEGGLHLQNYSGWLHLILEGSTEDCRETQRTLVTAALQTAAFQIAAAAAVQQVASGFC